MSSLPSLHRARRGAAALAVAGILAAGLVGCGDDSDSSSGDDSSSSAAADADADDAADGDDAAEGGDFVTAANAVCTDAYVAINEVSATIDPADPEGSSATITDEFLPAVQALQEGLEALTPDEDAAEAFQQALDNQAAAIEAVEGDPLALFDVDSTETDGLFDSIGLTACGSASSRRGGGQGM